MTTELYSRNWDFTLYNVDGKNVITVTFFGRVDYQRSFYLLKEVGEENYESLKEVSEDIRNNYEKYKNSEIIPAIFN